MGQHDFHEYTLESRGVHQCIDPRFGFIVAGKGEFCIGDGRCEFIDGVGQNRVDQQIGVNVVQLLKPAPVGCPQSVAQFVDIYRAAVDCPNGNVVDDQALFVLAVSGVIFDCFHWDGGIYSFRGFGLKLKTVKRCFDDLKVIASFGITRKTVYPSRRSVAGGFAG